GGGHQRGEHQREQHHDGAGAQRGAGGGVACAHLSPPAASRWPNTRGWVFMSSSGTQMFISSTANAMPSGKAPKLRINHTMRPMPAANSSLPRGVVAPETGSVTMKKAASMAPPLARWNSGEAKWPGSTSQNRPEMVASTPMK